MLDLAALKRAGRIPEVGFAAPALNPFVAQGPATWGLVRARLRTILRAGSGDAAVQGALRPAVEVELPLPLPLRVGGYTDFHVSRHYAANVGMRFRGPDADLPSNWLRMLIGT